jgi:hypothetical protein
MDKSAKVTYNLMTDMSNELYHMVFPVGKVRDYRYTVSMEDYS